MTAGAKSAPTVTTGAPTSVTSATAALAATANPNNADTMAWFQYATNNAFTSASTTTQQDLGSGASTAAFTASLTGLNPNTTYYFRAVASNSVGTVYGTAASFTTTAVQPTVTTGASSSVTSASAALAATANPNGADTMAWFQYATNNAFTLASTTTQQDLGSGTSTAAFNASLAGLNPNTTYYFRAVASNSVGTVYGTAASFTTTAVQPTVTTGASSSVTNASAALAATANPNGADTMAWFQYATNNAFTSALTTTQQDLGSGTSTAAFNASLTGLNPSTTYYFRAVASNSAGTAYGASASFTTTAAPAPGFSISGTSLTVTHGATSGNTSTITVTPSGGFTGNITLTAVVATSPANAVNPPTFSFSTNPVDISGASAGTSILTIATTPSGGCTQSRNERRGVPWYTPGGAALAFVLLFGIPARRRRWRALVGALALLMAITGGMMACGGGGGGTSNCGAITPGTTTGSYTITVTGTLGTTKATGTVALTVQ